MKKEKLSVEDGAMMRTLLDFPGGLELHIGVGHAFCVEGAMASVT